LSAGSTATPIGSSTRGSRVIPRVPWPERRREIWRTGSHIPCRPCLDFFRWLESEALEPAHSLVRGHWHRDEIGSDLIALFRFHTDGLSGCLVDDESRGSCRRISTFAILRKRRRITHSRKRPAKREYLVDFQTQARMPTHRAKAGYQRCVVMIAAFGEEFATYSGRALDDPLAGRNRMWTWCLAGALPN